MHGILFFFCVSDKSKHSKRVCCSNGWEYNFVRTHLFSKGPCLRFGDALLGGAIFTHGLTHLQHVKPSRSLLVWHEYRLRNLKQQTRMSNDTCQSISRVNDEPQTLITRNSYPDNSYLIIITPQRLANCISSGILQTNNWHIYLPSSSEATGVISQKIREQEGSREGDRGGSQRHKHKCFCTSARLLLYLRGVSFSTLIILCR